MNLSEAVSKVIDLAGRVRDYYDAELPKWLPNYPLVNPDEQEPPPEEKELSDFLAALPDDQTYQLILLMDLGCREFGIDNLPGYYETLRDRAGDPDYARSTMMWCKAILADQLSDGLEALRKHKINVDKMPLKEEQCTQPQMNSDKPG